MTDKNRPEYYVPPPASYVNNSPPPKKIIAQPSEAFVDAVVDILSERADLLVPGREIRITGTRIKVTPDDEEGLGVFFVPKTRKRAPFASSPLISINERALLHAQVPNDLPQGSYILRIVTRYSGTNLLKHHRVIDYKNIVSCEER
ncbi:MAG: DUF4469 domain-containing protein [Tannerellaceae bacterium]|jgi:hypothetical protein|nr:DUF4469 domain-containing protein [Tannerellaceae bacterium]